MIPTSLPKTFEKTVIQGLESDKICCTHNSRQTNFLIFVACMPGFKFPRCVS